MDNFKDKHLTYRLTSILDTTYIYNKDYIPFSLLFNLTHHYRVSASSLFEEYKREVINKNYKTNSIKIIKDSLNGWLNDTPTFVTIISGYSRHLISRFYNIMTDTLYFEKTQFRYFNRNYIKGYYSLFNQDLSECYFVLMVKKEYIKYVKLCVLLNEPILEDCFEYWYDEELINARGNNRIKTVNKKILKEFKLIDIPRINKSDIMGLLQPSIEFKAPSISKQKELISEFVDNFQNYENDLLNPKPKKADVKEIELPF